MTIYEIFLGFIISIVIDKINDVIYRIRKGPKFKPKEVHQDRLKTYKGENPPLWE
jgi:hypothetical protein